MSRRIPAVVVSGFLGSGKTTLVRRLLADAQKTGVRLAVISNEFGELGIDRALFGSAPGDIVELAGGCVCCQLSDELVETLAALRERADPDRVVIETSGVALPYDTQLHFWREPIRGWIEDDVAVVVVNAEQVREGRDLDGTFADQLGSADLIVLNQLDRVPAREVPALEARLREIEPDAPILHAVQSDVDPALLFPPDPDGLRARRRAEGAAPPPHGHERFEARELAVEPGIHPAELVARLAREGALRAKGFAATSEGVRVVQGVGARIALEAPAEPPPPDLVGRLVVIRRAARGLALLALALLLPAAARADDAALRFERDGALVREIPLASLRAGCGEKQIDVASDPYYGKPKRFLACPLDAVLRAGFGAWPPADPEASLFLRARDGYVRPTSASQLSEPGAWLAFADADVSGAGELRFEPIDRRQLDPAPFYLVWTGAGQNDPHRHPWPYQLVAIEAAPFESRFPHTRPTGVPADSPTWRGFAVFRRDCVACHAVNGEGGTVGPELNVPKSIVEYRPAEQIKAYIRDPQSFRYTSMPAHPHLSDADLDALLAYFSAMAQRKHDPRAAR